MKQFWGLLGWFMALSLLFSHLFSPYTLAMHTVGFDDVPQDHVFYYYIQNLKDKDIVGGYPDGNFYPENNVERGQMAKFVRKGIFGSGYQNLNCTSFADVPSTHVFYVDIQTLKCEGVISGFSNNTFRPTDLVTRGQAMKFVIAAVSKKVQDSQFPALQSGFNQFSDVPNSNPFHSFIMKAYTNGIVKGFNQTTFGPNEPVKRGAMSKMVWNTMLTQNYKVTLIAPANTQNLQKTSVNLLDECTDVETLMPGFTTYTKTVTQNKQLLMNITNQDFVTSDHQRMEIQSAHGTIINPDGGFPYDPVTTRRYGLFRAFYQSFGCTGFYSYYISELTNVIYPNSDYVLGLVASEGNSQYPNVTVRIYAIKGQNLIMLHSTLPHLEVFNQTQADSCASEFFKEVCYAEHVRKAINGTGDASIKQKVDAETLNLLTTFAL